MAMITCPDCNEQHSDAALTCPKCARQNAHGDQKPRNVGLLLGVGILLLPWIFSWFTLRKGHTTIARIVAFAWLVLVMSAQVNGNKDTTRVNSSQSTKQQSTISPLEQLAEAKPSDISPYGELAEMFPWGNDFTDLQRQLKFKEIHGKIIEWSLPVYEVQQSGDGYTIQTSSHFKGDSFGPKLIGTFLRISPRSESDRRTIEKLKTGDVIKIKGVIEDVSMRNLDIKPAILMDEDRSSKQKL